MKYIIYDPDMHVIVGHHDLLTYEEAKEIASDFNDVLILSVNWPDEYEDDEEE